MIRLVHFADLHLGSAFDGLPPDKAAIRRGEQLELLNEIVRYSNEQMADLLLLPGDLFENGERVDPETADSVAARLGRFSGRVFIAPGNHDYYSHKSVYATMKWPENVHIFHSRTIEKVLIPELSLCVYGAAFLEPTCERPLLEGFHADPQMSSVMVLHGELEAAFSRYNPISRDEIRKSGLDYLALGHTHSFSGISWAGRTAYAYPGCPEGRGFDEEGPKGLITGTLDEKGVRLNFVPMAKRQYGTLRFKVTDKLESELIEEIVTHLPAAAERGIFRVLLTGERSVGDFDLDRIRESLAPYFFHLFVHDETKAPRDLWEGIGSDTLRGIFLKNMRARYDAAETEEEREEILLALRFALAAIEGREAVL